jgi:hypothetical protein
MNPLCFLSLLSLRNTLIFGHTPNVKQDISIMIHMPYAQIRLGGNQINPYFFSEFAPERRKGIFSRLDLTAGEFPFTSLMTAGYAAGNKNLVAIHEQADGNAQRCISSGIQH